MNQKELIREVVSRVNVDIENSKDKFTQTEILKVLTAVEDIVVEQVRLEDEVKVFPGVVFKGEVKPASTARNPRTGEEVAVPEKLACKVHITGLFKDKINSTDED